MGNTMSWSDRFIALIKELNILPDDEYPVPAYPIQYIGNAYWYESGEKIFYSLDSDDFTSEDDNVYSIDRVSYIDRRDDITIINATSLNNCNLTDGNMCHYILLTDKEISINKNENEEDEEDEKEDNVDDGDDIKEKEEVDKKKEEVKELTILSEITPVAKDDNPDKQDDDKVLLVDVKLKND